VTYRERREARAERLREWADKREARAASDFEAVHTLADSIPFGQPILVGHHSERHARRDAQRIDSGMRRGIENANKAESMRSRADNIERAADHAIYSDDEYARQRLRERIADLEAKRARIVAYNASARKAAKAGGVGDVSLLEDRQRNDLEGVQRFAYMRKPGNAFPGYVTSNLGGNIGRLRERLAGIEAKAARTERAADAGGVLITESGEYCRITFAEKPDRSVLDALRGAGFWWSGGSWNGLRANLTHADTARDMALMPGEACPMPCVACEVGL
jgi:hypothetical protein